MVGARPNFIKIAPLFKELKKRKGIRAVLVHTGQHYDYKMSQVFFRDLDIPNPDYNLNVGSGTHAVQTGQVMVELERIFEKEKPACVVVVGDVNSTLAAAIVAAKLHFPIAHIEAGPRMFDRSLPEEINRVLTDHISDILFCPTRSSVQNLKNEGITKGVYFTGDTMYDVLLGILPAAAKKEKKLLSDLGLEPKGYILLTIHRAANTDDENRLRGILEAAIGSGEKIVFPVHPRTKKQLDKMIPRLSKLENFKNINFLDPLGYTEMVVLEKNAKKICTDSGGIQKEAYWLKIPCITMLDSAGWVETFQDGWNILVGADKARIRDAIINFNPKGRQRDHFGNGAAAPIMAKFLDRFLK